MSCLLRLEHLSGAAARIKARVCFLQGRVRKIFDSLFSGFARPGAAFEAKSGRLEDPLHEVDRPDARGLLDGLGIEPDPDGGDQPAEPVAVTKKVV